MYHQTKKGFTLLELLIVIGILAILSAVTILVINPAELLRKSRDAARASDLTELNKALSWLQVENPNFATTPDYKIYLSLPDSSATCGSYTLPPPPPGYTYSCKPTTTYMKNDSTGWIPIDFTLMSGGSVMSKLPIDPVNNQTYYYTFVKGGSWELTSLFESLNNHDLVINDGGSMPGVYELGTNLTLGPKTRDIGLVGYWSFDEGSGTTAYDYSGNGNTGTLTNGPTWQTSANCKQGGCLLFDGSNDYVDYGNGISINITGDMSIGAWVNPVLLKDYSAILTKFNSGYNGYRFQYHSYNLITLAAANTSGGIIGTQSDSGINTSIWSHIFVTKSGVNINFFINGANVGIKTLASATIRNDTTSLKTGVEPVNGVYLNGLIDDIRLYNRALSASEIQAIYNATK